MPNTAVIPTQEGSVENMHSAQQSCNEETPLSNPNTTDYAAEAIAAIELLLRRTLVRSVISCSTN